MTLSPLRNRHSRYFFECAGRCYKSREAVTVKITLWGKAEDIWKPLLSQEVLLEEKEHKHLYFTIPPEMFQKEYWRLKDLEEIELLISDKIPEKDTPGKLIFIEER